MTRLQTFLPWIAVVVLVGAACGVFLWEPWHGPVILSLSSTHGLDAGDLPAVVLVVLGIAIGHASVRSKRLTVPLMAHAWVGRISAIVLGSLLMVALVDSVTTTRLLPAGGGTFGGATQHADGPRPDSIDRWSHLAVTYDGRRVRLYVNGNEVSSLATSGRILRTSGPLWIGGNEPYGEFFQGDIDDVRVYDQALARSELPAEMSTPLGPAGIAPRSGLVAAYEFDAESGRRATDASGRGNTGSIIGAAWTSHGRFGDALRFDGAGEMVRIPASTSLDLEDTMTLAGWVRPLASQTGWRTVIHRQTDAYFLTAGGGHTSARLAGMDDLRLGALVLATVCLSAALVAGGGWLGGGIRAWWPPIVLFVAGSLVDAALAPSPALAAAALVAIWFAFRATGRIDRAIMWPLAAAFTAVSVASLANAVHLPGDDGSIARSGAVGVLLVAVALLGARRLAPAMGP